MSLRAATDKGLCCHLSPRKLKNVRFSLCHPGSRDSEFILEKIKMKHLFKALLNQIHYETEEKLGIGVKG